jgi:uncharacterized protein YkwD
MQLVNTYRARGASCGSYGNFGPTAPLSWSSYLVSSAARHSTDMAKNDFGSHTGSDGSDMFTRIKEAGYSPLAWAGENIAGGSSYSTAQSMVSAWMGSPVHCQAIMSPRFKDVGAACVKNSSGMPLWTMDLAAQN